MYDIQDPFAHMPLLRKWRSALFPELACFADARNLLRGKARESEYDSLDLHILKLLRINMANSLVPYVQVGFDFEALCKHGRFDLGRFEDKHTAFSAAYRIQVYNGRIHIVPLESPSSGHLCK